MDQERVDKMRRAMQRKRIDAIVVRLPENVLLLGGFWPMLGATYFVFPAEGVSYAVVPACYEDEERCPDLQAEIVHYSYGVLDSEAPALATRKILSGIAKANSWKRVGFEDGFESAAPSWNSAEFLLPGEHNKQLLSAAFPDAELIDVSSEIDKERRTKTEHEKQKLRIASEVSCIGLKTFDRMVQAGAAGVELAAAVEREIMVCGTGLCDTFRVRAFAQVAVGPDETAVGYRPNEVSTTRRLQRGDVALLELGVVVDGFWADRTRVRVAGTPTDEQHRIFQTVHRAQQAAVGEIRPGAKACHVDEAARTVIHDAGYGDCFPHITGHGLGFRYHESTPILSPTSAEVLEEGMLTSVEPGIYKKSVGGFRIEDDVLVTKNGAEVLGPHAKFLV